MIETIRNGKIVKEPGSIAAEWTPSPLDKVETIENADIFRKEAIAMSEIIREEDFIITRVGATNITVTPEKIILSVQQ